jgi:membrane protein implicated in regulation of membrane protease activity
MLESMDNYLIWCIAGIIVMTLEVTSGAFVLLMLGLSAFVVGLLTYFLQDVYFLTLATQLTIFSILSVITIWDFRKKLKNILMKNTQEYKADKNQNIQASQGINVRSEATIQYQGTSWTAYNDGEHQINAGDTIQIVKTEGVKLFVRKN